MMQGCMASCMHAAPAASLSELRLASGRPAAVPSLSPALAQTSIVAAAAAGSKVHPRCSSWRQMQQRQRCRRVRANAPAALPPGVESAAVEGASGGLLGGLQGVLGHHAALYVLELLLAGAAAYAAAAWPTRPRGWAFKELVMVAPSQVAGTGLFAAVTIPGGTVIGSYPGRPRSAAEMVAKCAAAPGARDYAFKTRDGRLLDPTDAAGQLSPSPAPGLPWLPVDVSLAYINEPPKGAGGTNVTVEDDPSDPAGLLCVAARDISAGEELFMDYGPTYDRSRYTADVAAGPGGARQQDPAERGESV